MWQPDTFLLAVDQPPHTKRVEGYVYRGLGIHQSSGGSPKGRRKPEWVVTHLGSGCSIASIAGDVATAFPVATKIAECGDWDFIGIDGWRNRDPEIGSKVRAILDAHKNARRDERDQDRDLTIRAAQAVAMASERQVDGDALSHDGATNDMRSGGV